MTKPSKWVRIDSAFSLILEDGRVKSSKIEII
jgi:hypothetical protein